MLNKFQRERSDQEGEGKSSHPVHKSQTSRKRPHDKRLHGYAPVLATKEAIDYFVKKKANPRGGGNQERRGEISC